MKQTILSSHHKINQGFITSHISRYIFVFLENISSIDIRITVAGGINTEQYDITYDRSQLLQVKISKKNTQPIFRDKENTMKTYPSPHEHNEQSNLQKKQTRKIASFSKARLNLSRKHAYKIIQVTFKMMSKFQYILLVAYRQKTICVCVHSLIQLGKTTYHSFH